MLVGETSWSETSASETSGSRKSGAKRPGPNYQGATRPGPKYQEAKLPGPKRQGAKRPGPKMSRSVTTSSETSGSETSRSRMSGSETSWSKMSEGETSRSNISGEGGWWNVLAQNVRGLNVQVKMSRGETSCPKCRGSKRPGTNRLSPKSPGAKTLPEPSLYDCETSSMIMTFPEISLWFWGSFLLLFKSDLWLINWFELTRGNMILLIKNFHLEMIF